MGKQRGREVALVTGPMRSGTSCVTGLLELCGFDLGRSIRVLRDSTEHNPRGHFETDLLYTINSRLLSEVPGGCWSILSVPESAALARQAAARARYFQIFIRRFDGDLIKDPLMCLTVGFWEKQWPQLRRVVYCLRNPLAVARSMQKRYLVSVEHGLELWRVYTTRFFDAVRSCAVYVLDFDAFVDDPVESLASVLRWLERPTPREAVAAHLESFFGAEHVHWHPADDRRDELPPRVAELYGDIRCKAGPWERGRL